MTVFRTLTEDDFDAILHAFNDAFSDYVVPQPPKTAAQMREIMLRRGYVPALSVAGIDDGRIVAFTLNGFDGSTAYDSGTGVIPSQRRRHLGEAMFAFIIPRLRAAGAQQYVLEVIGTNTPALRLYEKLDFATTRMFTCWRFDEKPTPAPSTEIAIRPIDPDWSVLKTFCDVEPSWQNSIASIQRAGDPVTILGAFDGGDLVGYAVVFPKTVDLAQLAVHRSHRRRGVGAALLRRAAREAGGVVRILNIDASGEGIASFLRASSATEIVQQREMLRML